LNDKLRVIQKAISDKYLETSWPGSEGIALQQLFPGLHLYLLLTQAIQLDPHISDSYTELTFITSVMATFSDDFSVYIETILPMLREKMRTSLALSEALKVLRRTRVAPNVRTCSIGEFEFLKRISRGAFGSVFLAAKKTTGDIFAIKAVPRRTVSQKNQVDHLLTERDILLHFRSPHVVKFYYSMVGANNLYLVTEFVPGGDLYSLLENVGALPESAAKFYGFEVICALQYLRENGIIHRDIKPDNILVTADGHLKLTDFGLSHRGMVDRQASDLSQAASFVGTPDYVAPEIILNQPHSFSVDYWSLGVMLYEFVCGVPPFHEDTERETYRRVLVGNFRWPADVPCTREFRDLIGQLLTKNPLQRLGHASIAAILQHPWFLSGGSAEPPFVPHLASRADTGYFEQRYEFNGDEDASVLMDLADGGTTHAPSELPSFPSIDFAELGEANRTVAEEFDRANIGEGSPVRREDAPAGLARPASVGDRCRSSSLSKRPRMGRGLVAGWASSAALERFPVDG
jgi:serine/threonine protein kinase